MVEIYNEVVHDLLSDDAKRQVELQKTASGFDIPAITTIGARCTRPSLLVVHFQRVSVLPTVFDSMNGFTHCCSRADMPGQIDPAHQYAM